MLDVSSAVLTFYEPDNPQLSFHANRFVASLYLSGATWYGFCILSLLSPVLNRKTTSETELEAAKKLVNKYGQTPLAFFTVDGDKHFFFHGNSLVAYQVLGRVCLILGDPVGPAAELEEIARAFSDLANKNDWLLCFYQVRKVNKPLYQKLGYRSIAIGQEAVVETASFTLNGKEGKDLRNVKNKIERFGFSVEDWSEKIRSDHQATAPLKIISDSWLELKKKKEMHFSMGQFSRLNLFRQIVLVVLDTDKKPIAFVSLIPDYGEKEVAIDLMRHLPNPPNGTMDYMFIETLLWAREHGLERVNLGLSPLAGVGEETSAPLVEKLLRQVYRNTKSRYNFQGLHAFKNKFKPKWEEKYLIFRNVTDLPLIGKALLDAHS